MSMHAMIFRPAWSGLLAIRTRILVLVASAVVAPAMAVAWETPERLTWTITRRVVTQDQPPERGQTWQVDYWLRNNGHVPRVLLPAEVSALVEGWVSNSRVPSHGTPRRSSLTCAIVGDEPAVSEVIASRDDSQRCDERASLRVWPASVGESPPDLLTDTVLRIVSPVGFLPMAVAPGESLRVRLRLEHAHFLYGPYEPLLGQRALALRLGPDTLSDHLPLDQELRPERSVPSWPQCEPSADRLDTQVFLSAPHSLHLEAHIPGNAHYRFSGPVRYATRMRLSYWYLTAPGTEGDCKARITQVKQGPTLWKSLPDGEKEDYLSTVGRWTRVDRVIRTEPEATHLTLEFRLTGDIGEMWIDNLMLEPLADDLAGP